MISESKKRIEKKVVLDTNILISALVFRKGPPNALFRLFGSDFIRLYTSHDLLQELSRVLKRKFKISDFDHDNLIGQVVNKATIVRRTTRLTTIKKDLSDNRVLECAVAAKADYIVSGDRHLLSLKEFKGIQILKALEFLKIIYDD